MLSAMRSVAVVACFMAASLTLAVSAAWWDTPSVISGDNYGYDFFRSTNDSLAAVRDGESGVGAIGYTSFVSAVVGRNRIAVSDMSAGGSAIRIVDADGIWHLSGSYTAMGYRDGSGDDALFRGVNNEVERLNGLSYIGGNIYLADTGNNAIRVIAANGTTSTMINGNSRVEGRNVSYPVFVSSFADGNITLFVSDSGNSRILTVTQDGDNPPLLSVFLSGVNTGPLAYSTNRGVLYYTYGEYPMALGAIGTRSQQAPWNVSSNTLLGYKNSLVLSEDQTELLYYGTGNTNVLGVYAVRVDVDPSLAGAQVPTLRFPWPLDGSSTTTTDEIRSIMPHSATSYYIVTEANVYVISTAGPLPDQSDSGSGSGSNSSGSGSDSSSSWRPFPGREHGIGGFPNNAFPTNDSCLMSQLYYYLRMDATEAYNTSDYYTQFAPITNIDMAVFGDVNVSEWCGNITSRHSNDGTVAILDFWGPMDLALWLTQGELAGAPWTNTQRFLDDLRADGWDLGPFCFYNCSTQCETATASESMCVGYQRESSCDDICKGAIASSVVMACAGVVLIVLMAVSPANLFTALIMVPLI